MNLEFQCKHCGQSYFVDSKQVGKVVCHSECGGLTSVGGIARQRRLVPADILKIRSAKKWMRQLVWLIAIIAATGGILLIFSEMAGLVAFAVDVLLIKGSLFYMVYARYLCTGRFILSLFLALFFWPPFAITSIFTYRELKKQEKFFSTTAEEPAEITPF